MNTKVAQKLKELPKTPGVYIYRNKAAKVIYVGKAINLKNRVISYFQNKDLDAKTTELVKNIENLEWLNVESEFEALMLEAELIKRYRPKYNIDWKDDKNYAYIKFSGEKYPRVSVVHQITDHEARYIGPFIDTKAMKTILKLARKIFPYCTCNLPQDEICLYYHLGLCPGHGPKYISEADYKKNIEGLAALFSGKTKKLSEEFKRGMKKASVDQQFELAAKYRDRLHFLKRIEHTHLFTDRDISVDKGITDLTQQLQLSKLPKKIECFDISNVLGTSAVGSMVVFRSGIASPKDYRRFQIKTVKGADDFRMMAEVLGRRFSLTNIKAKDAAFSDMPDLVILDGGKGQLSTVLKSVQIPEGVTVVSLAKRFEEIFRAEITKKGEFVFQRTILPKDSEALFLVQRVRDEAHRFAVSYHRKVRDKAAFETSLDAVVGVGPKTKKKLLSEFGSIKRIREASVEELSKVVGEKIATKIKENL